MDSFEFTKIAGAALSALLLIFGTKTIVDMETSRKLEKPGYALPSAAPAAQEKTAEAKEGAPEKAEGGAAETDASASAGGGDVMALLAKASADNGKSAFSKCKTCHVVENGKSSTVGPNLWGVLNRKKAMVEGFAYSEAMKTKGGEWTFENLSQFIRNPKSYIPGTKMVFNGIADPAVEADLIAYLATLADTPVPLPK